jgi:putative spermidine/putrescine transport system permease protein
VERVRRGVTNAAFQEVALGDETAPQRRSLHFLERPGLLVLPLVLVLVLFFVGPLLITLVVSFWNYTEYSIEPAFVATNYSDIFYGCLRDLPRLCVTFSTYLSTLKFCAIVLGITMVLGFCLAWFLVFEVSSTKLQMLFFLLLTVPFWTSNVIRMISWIPLLGRNGLINDVLQRLGIADEPVEWLLYSDFAVTLALVHLYTMFMMVPLVNTMLRIDKSLIEAAQDAGASFLQILWMVVLPLCRPGFVVGAIFVVTIVMGDFLTIGVMGGQQIASVGKVIQVQMSFLQFPIAAANSIVLLAAVLVIIWGMTRLVDVRKEL